MVRDPAENVEDTWSLKEKRTALVACIKSGEREQLILKFVLYRRTDVKEIAEILEVSIPRVSQIHGKTIAKLRTLIEEELA